MLQYEIEYKGAKYFGNVTLKENHRFEYGGEFYLLDVEGMVPHKLPESTYLRIARLSSYPDSLIPEGRMQDLRNLNLVEGEEASPQGAPVNAAPNGTTVSANSNGGESADGFGKASETGVVSIALLVAQECNMSCIYCYGQGGGYGGGGLMSEETAFKAVDWLMENSKKAERVNVSFFGGEPLLNFPLVQKVVEYAKDAAHGKGKTITFSITTNASLLTDKIISFMSREKIYPLVSFDGPREIHDRQRPFKDGRGSYETVRTNIGKLLDVYPRLAARAIAYSDANPLSIEAGMREAGLTSCSVGPYSPVIMSRQEGDSLPACEAEKIVGPMIELSKKEKDDLLRAVKNRCVTDNSIAAFTNMLISGKKLYFGCGVGKSMVGISAPGDIYPCHRFVGLEESKMGNVYSYRVEGINEYYRAVVCSLPGCRFCWARYFCGGGCFYHNKAYTGDMHRPVSSFCEIKKTALEIAISAYFDMDEGDREFLKTTYRDIREGKIP